MSKTVERTFHLTQEDIDIARKQYEAEGNHAEDNHFDAGINCPVHRCLARELVPGEYLTVDEEAANIWKGEEPESIQLPEKAREFIRNFDDKRFEECKPFDFTLEVPEGL
jgi:hypothetical protein